MNHCAKHNKEPRQYRIRGTTTFVLIVLMATFLCYRWMYLYDYRRSFDKNIISAEGVYERSQEALEAIVSIKYSIIGDDRDKLLTQSKNECGFIVENLVKSGVKEDEIYLVERDLLDRWVGVAGSYYAIYYCAGFSGRDPPDRWEGIAGSYSSVYSMCFSDYVRRGLAMDDKTDWRKVGHFNIVRHLMRYEARGQIIVRTNNVDLAEKLSSLVYGKRKQDSAALYNVQVKYRHGINEAEDKEMIRKSMRYAKDCADISSGDRRIRSLLNCSPTYEYSYLYGDNFCDATRKTVCHTRRMSSSFTAV